MERLLSCYLEKIYYRPPHRDMDKGLHKIESAFKREVEAGKKQRIKSLLNKESERDYELLLDGEGSTNAAKTGNNFTMTFEGFLSKVLVIGNDHGIILTNQRGCYFQISVIRFHRSWVYSTLVHFLVNVHALRFSI